MRHASIFLVMMVFAAAASAGETDVQRAKAKASAQAGNFKDAYEIFQTLALDPKNDSRKVPEDYNEALTCLQRLGRYTDTDALRDKAVEIHAGNWRLLLAAAQSLIHEQHYGYIVAGKFYRAHHRGGGQYVQTGERDRVRALQLMNQAMPLLKAENDKLAASEFYMHLSYMLLSGGGHEPWRLQYLSDFKELPDYADWSRGYGRSDKGAPVNADGSPLFYKLPKSFEDAANDGERWRWALMQSAELNPANRQNTMVQFATFLQQQFDVRSMSWMGRGYGANGDDDDKDESGPYAVSTLSEEETIAKLATGAKRFKLPDEFNFIKIFRQVVNENPKGGYVPQALSALAQTFEDRQQYVKAAECWAQLVRDFPQDWYRQRLDQIVKNWGQFEGVGTQPAGQNATVEFRYRNGNKVSFVAHEIDIAKLLGDVKAYIRAKPKQLDWQKMDISNIGYRLVEQQQKQYVGRQVAAWELDLKPREKHLDRRVTVTTPLANPGAYLVTAQMADGNVSRVVLWVADTAIVRKQLSQKNYYFVADARSGQPIPGAKLEFFGYQQRWNNNNQFTDVVEFMDTADADGQLMPAADRMPQNHQWIATATTAEGRFAFLGFQHVWYGQYQDPQYNQAKAFTMTDRPVYRPNQAVKFKCWLGQAKYDFEGQSPQAGRAISVIVRNPKGEKILEKSYTADEFGGFDGELVLGKEATLGQYSIQVVNWWPAGNFRVEEYKKPEYEVKIDAPTEPVMLGEKITATITSKYYFGAPVTDAKVKYKVLRHSYTANWYPAGTWDWFYQSGYWWFGCDYAWYPGWEKWGCRRPSPWWWGGNRQQPEVVVENEVPVGADGTVKVEIDTALAKAMHGDTDHKYELTAEVTDQSRRTIVGTGNVMVARNPFKVYAWVDRGHYRTGDVVRADFSAQTLDNKPVKGKGELKLLKITYDQDKKPVETVVQSWALDTDEQGKAQQQIKAAEAGQYRVSYKVTDAKNRSIEGGYVFCVIGEGFDGSEFRFNNVELIADKREYKVGEKVQLMVNSNRVGGTVILFTRPANGIYLPPKIIRLKGKSTLEEIEIAKADMPNFFVEAFTVSDGKYYSEVREIIVPPENKVLSVEVKPSAAQYKPGEKAKVQLKLTDATGEPFAGSTVVTVYDKSVEYISGGSNVPEIKSHFWKWRRHHQDHQSANSLRAFSANLLSSGEVGMQFIGAFGDMVAQLDDEVTLLGAELQQKNQRRNRGEGGGFGGSARELRKAGAPAAPAAANAMEADGAPMEFAAAKSEKKSADKADLQDESDPNAQGPDVEPTVRKNFADTAFWMAKLNTNANGIAELEVPMPESLTTWKIKVWGIGHSLRVGQGETEVITSKNLIIRMQAPRFFTQKDEVVLSANVHNYLAAKKSVKVSLDFGSGVLDMDTDEMKRGGLTRTIEIEPKGEQRVDWRVKVVGTGEASIRMKALTDEESDAMELKFPAYIHGMQKTESFAGNIRPDKDSASLTFSVPAERRAADSRLEVRYSPTLAGAMVDALPYLTDYPYGCTEQTLSRFLPTVITQKVLNRMNVNLRDVQQKITNLNAQEIGNDVERAKQWKRYDRNPVFDEQEVISMVKAGIERLNSMQCGDGGWGWFSGNGERSYPHTTAYVVHGLQIARGNGVALPDQMLKRGLDWLKRYQDEQLVLLRNAPAKTNPYKTKADNLDAFVFMVLTDAKMNSPEMLEALYRDRIDLAVYSKAMFGLALQKLGDKEKLAMIMQNIEQFLVQDEENQTAYLKLPENNYWWSWYGSEYEAQAYYLKLLSAADPKGEKASRLVKYLINNRKHGSYWNSTRDTAVCVEAMAEYLTASGEDGPDMKLEVILDGKKAKEVAINASNLFTFDNKVVLSGEQITTGEHKLEFKKTGKGPLYFNAYMSNFTLEDDIKKAGLEVKVQRKYYKLNRVDKTDKVQGARGQALDQKVEKYERQELANLASLKSGDLVEIELEIDSKNDYEYILFEDMKAAGFEPVEVRSGYNGNSMGAYMELRDERVCFFIRSLARGKHSVSYKMRAEIPGKFSALPTKVSGMYAPELKANSDEIKLQITD